MCLEWVQVEGGGWRVWVQDDEIQFPGIFSCLLDTSVSTLNERLQSDDLIKVISLNKINTRSYTPCC